MICSCIHKDSLIKDPMPLLIKSLCQEHLFEWLNQHFNLHNRPKLRINTHQNHKLLIIKNWTILVDSQNYHYNKTTSTSIQWLLTPTMIFKNRNSIPISSLLNHCDQFMIGLNLKKETVSPLILMIVGLFYQAK